MKKSLISVQFKLCIFTILFVPLISNSQIINNFGIKGGLIVSRISLSDFNEEVFPNEPTGKYNFLSFDIGLFAETFNSKYFCVSTELHYKILGENDDKQFTVIIPETNGTIETYVEKNVSDRFHYLSLQILPRWKYSYNKAVKLYLFAGPRLDVRMSNSSSVTDNAVKFDNNRLEAGITFGIGSEILDLLDVELRYEHNLTNVYKITYGNQTFNRKHNTFYVLAGVSLKKLLKTK